MDEPQLKALDPKQIQRLDDLFETCQRESKHVVGYPCNGVFDYSPLLRFMQFPINNVGDPYQASNFHINTHTFECEVLALFGGLTQAPADTTWGYVTNGGTEGNMYGIFLARELYPDGIVYYSQDTHYSVDKILRCLKMRSVMIRSTPDGCIDLDDLRETLKIHRDVPPIVFANIGTTMKGAVDDVEGIEKIFSELAIKRRYIHADAALSGMILPFVEDPPKWDFSSGIDSLSTSGHKMIGSPIPCGMVLAKKAHVDRIAQSVEYIGTLDTTISGSRNGLTPLFLWYAFQTVGTEGYGQLVRQCLANAQYAEERLQQAGLNAWRHKNSLTVVFDRPSMEIVGRWQLAVHHEIAHLISMPHVTKERIDQLVDDISTESQPPQSVHTIEQALDFPNQLPHLEQSKNKLITLLGPSRPSLLQEISSAMASAKVNIESLTAQTVDDMDIISMTVDDHDRALQILKRCVTGEPRYGQTCIHQDTEALQVLMGAQLRPVSEEAILVQIADQSGALAQLTERLMRAEIGIRGVRILHRGKEKAIVAIACDQPKKAQAVIADIMI